MPVCQCDPARPFAGGPGPAGSGGASLVLTEPGPALLVSSESLVLAGLKMNLMIPGRRRRRSESHWPGPGGRRHWNWRRLGASDMTQMRLRHDSGVART